MSKLIPLPSRLCKYQPLKLPDSSTHAYKPVHGMNFIWLLRMILLLCPCTVWNCRWASHRTPMSGGVTVAVASSQSQHRQLPLLLLGERHESVYAPSAKSKLKTKSIRASSSGVLSSSQVQDLEPKLEVEEENVTMFKGRNIDLDALFVPRHRVPDVSSFAVSDKDEDDPQEDVFLYFGGCLLQRISPNDSANDTNTQHSKLQMTPTVPLQVLVHQTLVGAHNEGRFGLWDDLLLGPQGAASAPGERPEAAFTVTSSQVYDMLRTEDHRRPYELLVGRRNPLYRPPSGHGRTPFSALDDEPDDKEEAQRQAEISADGNAEVLTRPKPSQPQYVDKQWRTVSMGHLWAITAQQRHMQHYLLISVDRFGQPSVYSHRYAAISDAKPEPAAAPAECTSGEPSTPLRVLTYNLWHHNPPSWVSPYKDPQVRWDRYVQRLHAFAKVILNSNADVVLVQEVRLDNAFNAGMGAPFPEEPPSQSRAASPDAAGMAERDRVAEAAWRRALAAGQPAAPRSSSGPSGSPRGLWELFSHYPRHEFGDANPSNHTTMQGEADAKEWLGSVGPLDAGHQLSHLLAALRAQECWRHKIHPLEAACWAQHAGSASADSPPLLAPWRYVYQPAMNMVEKGAWGARHEEGVAILSRHPMTSVDALILPRELTNPKDDHTRVVLRAKLRVPVTEASNTSHENSCRHGGYKEVLVMTSHFSLHAPSRQEGVSYLLANTPVSEIPQLLGGDLNAEPHEPSIAGLTAVDPKAANTLVFRDSMLHAQRVIPYDSPYVWNSVLQTFVSQPYLFTSSNASRTSSHILHGADDKADGRDELCLTLSAARAGELAEGDLDAQCDSARSALLSTCCPSWALQGYTFPACNPTKRIDFLFVRDTITEPAQNVTIRKHWVVGTEPDGVAAQALSAGYVEKFRTAALGMLDEGSPLWASDHFGVVVELNL